MAMLNQCSFLGRLGKDPEMNYTPNGKAVTKFSLAVDQGKDQKVMWLTIICWEKLAETVEQYASKGMLVYVQGKLQLREYKDKNKVDRLSVEITASIVQLLEKRQKDEGDLPDFEDEPV